MPTDGAPATPPVVTVRRADYRDPTDAKALVELLDLYAREPIGGGMPLDTTVRADLGLELVAGDLKTQRLERWREFTRQYPQGYLYCFRGGLRSRTVQQWLR